MVDSDVPVKARSKWRGKAWKDMSPRERKQSAIGCLGATFLCGICGVLGNIVTERQEARMAPTQTAEARHANETATAGWVAGEEASNAAATAEQIGLATLRAEKAGTQQSRDATGRAAPATTTIRAATDPSLLARVDFGDEWPLTVESGRVECGGARAVTFEANGRRYSVNGTAQTLYPSLPKIDEIWAPDPIFEGMKIDISPILDAGLALCK